MLTQPIAIDASQNAHLDTTGQLNHFKHLLGLSRSPFADNVQLHAKSALALPNVHLAKKVSILRGL